MNETDAGTLRALFIARPDPLKLAEIAPLAERSPTAVHRSLVSLLAAGQVGGGYGAWFITDAGVEALRQYQPPPPPRPRPPSVPHRVMGRTQNEWIIMELLAKHGRMKVARLVELWPGEIHPGTVARVVLDLWVLTLLDRLYGTRPYIYHLNDKGRRLLRKKGKS